MECEEYEDYILRCTKYSTATNSLHLKMCQELTVKEVIIEDWTMISARLYRRPLKFSRVCKLGLNKKELEVDGFVFLEQMTLISHIQRPM